MGAYAQVAAPTDGRRQVAAGCAHAHAVDQIHGVGSRSGGRRIVRVVAARKSERRAGLDESSLPGSELGCRMATQWDGASLRVPLVTHVEIVLEALERGEALRPTPVPKAERGPFVVIVGLPAEGDAGVDRRRAADDSPAREPVEEGPTRPRTVQLSPVVPAHRVAGAVAQVGGYPYLLRIVRARFDEEHVPIASLRRACCDDGARRPRPHDDDVRMHRGWSVIRRAGTSFPVRPLPNASPRRA